MGLFGIGSKEEEKIKMSDGEIRVRAEIDKLRSELISGVPPVQVPVTLPPPVPQTQVDMVHVDEGKKKDAEPKEIDFLAAIHAEVQALRIHLMEDEGEGKTEAKPKLKKRPKYREDKDV